MAGTDQLPIFGQSKLYRASARLLQVGRFAVLTFVFVMALLVVFPRDGSFVNPPAWWPYAFFAVLGFWMVAIGASVALATLLRCDQCGRRPTITWNHAAKRLSKRQGLREFLFPSALQTRTFKCGHCGVHFQLA